MMIVDIWHAFAEFFRDEWAEPAIDPEDLDQCGRFPFCYIPMRIEACPDLGFTPVEAPRPPPAFIIQIPAGEVAGAIDLAVTVAESPVYSDEMRLAVRCMAAQLEETLRLPVIHGP